MSLQPYVVRYGPGLEREIKLAMFANVLELLQSFKDASINFEVYNADHYDYATDTGVSDGLTDDEREQVWEYR